MAEFVVRIGSAVLGAVAVGCILAVVGAYLVFAQCGVCYGN